MLTITIIGMGLIGTSLGMALRAADVQTSPLGAVRVTGYDQQSRATSTARGRLAIDREARSLADALRDARLVLLAVPVRATPDVLRDLAPLLAAGTIVSDTGSTKAQVCAWARDLLPAGVDFVGGHPMAGSEKAGPQAATADLFQGAIYCLTPSADARQEAVDTAEAFVRTVGARPYYIDPAEHDAYVAGISHLPFLLSTVLVEAVSRSPGWPEMAALAATGFRDISRRASGDPVMHRDICLTNQAALTRWIDEAISLLTEVRAHLATDDAARLDALFRHARDVRDLWLESKPGLRPGEAAFRDTPRVERPNLLGFRFPSGRKDDE